MRSESRAILGQNVGHIRVTDLLGEGGMGAVYVGYDDTLERKVALKAIRGDFRVNPESKARFLREARILSKLDHPGVCRVHDFVSDDDSDYLVMELIEGRNLRQAMTAGLDDREKRSIARQLLEVLVEVHEEGITHRDLKPENIMVTPQGGVKVLDFGLSRLSEDEFAEMTTAAFMPGMEAPSNTELEMRGSLPTQDEAREHPRNGRLYEPRTGARRSCNTCQRHVLDRADPAGVVHREATVRRWSRDFGIASACGKW